MNNKAAMIGLAVLLFLVAAVLVLLIVRMLFGGRLRMSGGRARQARLGIVDAFDLDRQRQLIIVRRDNTEHLIMIGGPNDILIESEIVRVEARELRDQRRDKQPDMPFPGNAGFGDARIPAPPPADREATDRPIAPPLDEPLLPEMVAPPQVAVAPSAQPPAPAARAPTFPLPPRRPPPSATPERRPAPPLRLPESVTRGDDIPMPPSAGPAPLPVPPVPAAAPAPASSPVTTDVAPVPPRPAPPPFLKPRPPIRPLQRTTPQAQPPASTAPAVPAPPLPPVEVKPAPQPVAPPAPPAPPPAPAPAVPPPAPAESNDALESLEEEMAKLLGRGP